MDHLSRLTAHLIWADQRALDALSRAVNPDPAAVELYAHILGAEHVWLARLHGRTPRVAVWPALSREDCERLAKDNANAFSAYVSGLTGEDIDRQVTYRNSAGLEFTSSVEDILLHVCLHGSYHRGQIARALRQGGAVPEPTDYIGFIRGSPAATREPPR